jgi:hypothetical protein
MWQYAPGGVMSDDGSYQVSGRDRFSYYFRANERIAVLPCEHFDRSGTPTVAFNLSGPIEFMTARGNTLASADDTSDIKNVLTVALPMMGRAVVFD